MSRREEDRTTAALRAAALLVAQRTIQGDRRDAVVAALAAVKATTVPEIKAKELHRFLAVLHDELRWPKRPGWPAPPKEDA